MVFCCSHCESQPQPCNALRRRPGQRQPRPAEVSARQDIDGIHSVSLEAEGDQAGALIELGQAQNMDNAASRFLDPLTHVSKPPVQRNGGEMVLETQDALCDYPRIIDVLRKSPKVLNTEASRQRLEMASKAGSLVVAVDAAETIKPRNSRSGCCLTSWAHSTCWP